jgi:uncharacterized RDD family membrane protein YckC/predicted RNA-binding Zn-ribbon protein involved in translation (DUF1610 family)
MALLACSECQSRVSDRAFACPHCGNVITRCPECVSEVRRGMATCANCGYPLATAQTPQLSSTSYDSLLLPDTTLGFGVALAPVMYAGFWRRAAAAFIDVLLVSVVLFTCDIILYMINASTLTSLVNLAGALAYSIGLECSSHQATLGKQALGIIVTDMHGNRIKTGRAVGRHFSKGLSALTFGIGYVMAAFTQRKQALHDKMAGTLVVVKPTSR